MKLSSNNQFLKGIIIGSLFFLSYLNLIVFTPILILLFLYFGKTRERFPILLSLLLGVTFIFAILEFLFIKRGENLIFEKIFIINILVLFSSCLIIFNIDFIRGLCYITLFLFSIDLLINISSFLLKADVLARTIDIRDDGKVRLNGILGHPFLSVAVSLIGFISFRILKFNNLSVFALLNLLINQTSRAQLVLVLIIAFEILYKFGKKYLFFNGFIVIIIMAYAVFTLTIKSDDQSNVLRFAAWGNSLINIIESPLVGNTNFSSFEKENGVSEDILLESGISENQYLDIALHWGIPIAILYFLILLSFFYYSVKNLNIDNPIKHNFALFSFICLADSIWGNLMITGIIIFFFASLFGAHSSTLNKSYE